MSIDYVSIGARIKYYRNKHSLSQMALADMIGISRQYMSHLELGEKVASLDTIISIANALQIPSDDLLVDNLTNSKNLSDCEAVYILLDCTANEQAILINNMKELKKILKRYHIE